MKAIIALLTFPIRIVVIFLTANKRKINKQEIQKIKTKAIEYTEEKYEDIKNATKKTASIKEVQDILHYLKEEKNYFVNVKASINFIDSISNFSLNKTLEEISLRWESVQKETKDKIAYLKEKAKIYQQIQLNINKLEKIKEKINTKIEIEERKANFKEELGVFANQLDDLISELRDFDFSQDEAIAKKIAKDALLKANKISIDYDQKLKTLEGVLKKIDKFINWFNATELQVNNLVENNYFAAEKMKEKLSITKVDLENLRFNFDFVEANSLYEQIRSEYDKFIKINAPKT